MWFHACLNNQMLRKAGPNDWAECAPPKFKDKMSKNKGGYKRKGAGADGMKGKTGDGICYSFRDTGKCRFGVNCKFKHGDTTKVKRIKMSKSVKDI